MRKLISILLLIVLGIFVAVLPVAAQNDTPAPTIAEVVVNSAGGETPEFATLLAAVQAADPSVLEALSDPEASLTVFAPTDAAFAALAEALGEDAFNAVLADPTALTNILLYHVVSGNVPSADLIAMFDGPNSTISVPTLNGQSAEFTLREDNVIEVNGGQARIAAVDIAASNGVIHVIDAVILPESRTIADIVVDSASAETPEFATLLAAIQAADPAVLETLSDPAAELTVFAPTDAAFAALAESLGEEAFNGVLADTPALTDILLYHVVPGVLRSGDILAYFGDEMMDMEMPEYVVGMNADGGLEVTMANGDSAVISANDDGVFINDAQIVTTDIDAANGVIHVISAVILPPSE